MDGRQCSKCGEAERITLIASDSGLALIREHWRCQTCGTDFVHWVEKKHKPFGGK